MRMLENVILQILQETFVVAEDILKAFGIRAECSYILSERNTILSQGWWKEISQLVPLPETHTNLPLWGWLFLGVIGFCLLFSTKRIPKMLLVTAMGILEVYYFIYRIDAEWFYNDNVLWLLRLFLLIIIAIILTIQCVLTDETKLEDKLNEDHCFAIDDGYSSLVILVAGAVIYYITHYISIWTGAYEVMYFIGYGLLVGLLILVFMDVRPNFKKPLSLISFIVYIVSLSGVMVTMANFFWTGLFALILFWVCSSVKDGRSKVYSAKISVDSGDSRRAYELGNYYLKGEEIDKDEQKAVECFKIAADSGDAKAYAALSRCYMRGNGVPRDGNKGLELAMKSYHMGHMNACAIIAAYYRMNTFIPVDHINGHKWDMIGAKAGVPTCQIRIAMDYEHGNGNVRKDIKEAARWYKRVIDNERTLKVKEDLAHACWKYAGIQYTLGNDSEGNYYLRKAADLGNKHAMAVMDKYRQQS